MPSDLGFKAMNAIHRLLLKVSGGRAGWTAMDMPVLELTTKGRKSGQPRSVMLTSPVQQGSALVVVASRGGDDRSPAWFLNLRDNPDVEVRLQGKPRQRMHARVATAADYQIKTTREIPLVLLEPVS
jgi:deazaflavin-dependent oxidoreductase (nitroreductase family)